MQFRYLVLFYLFVKSSCIFSLQYHKTSFARNVFLVGSPPQANSLPFNTLLPFTWISKGSYQLDKSKTGSFIQNKTVILDGKIYKCTEYEDVFKIEFALPNALVIENFHFYSVDIMRYYYKNSGIGLGFKFEKEQLSFVHQLYNLGKINQRVFAFSSRNSSLLEVYFGGIPNNSHLHFANKASFKVNENYYTWGCNLSSINVNEKHFTINKYAFIRVSYIYSIVSNEFFDYINETILKPLYEEEICLYSKKIDDDHIECRNGNLAVLPKIKFNFNDFYLNIPLNLLFNCDLINKCLLTILKENIQHSDFAWTIGEGMISLFNYTLFDYDNKEVSFYSNIIDIGSNRKLLLLSYYWNKNIYIFLIIILTMGICFEIVVNKLFIFK